MDKAILIVLLTAMLVLIPVAISDTTSTKITFKVPSAIAHSIDYRTPCSATVFFFVENDTTKDGYQLAINASDSTAANFCYSGSTPPMNITNDGNVDINVTAQVNETLSTMNLSLKVSQTQGGYSPGCASTEPPTSTCLNLTTSPLKIITYLSASSTQDIWVWSDFWNFLNGVSGENSTDLNTTAVAST